MFLSIFCTVKGFLTQLRSIYYMVIRASELLENAFKNSHKLKICSKPKLGRVKSFIYKRHSEEKS